MNCLRSKARFKTSAQDPNPFPIARFCCCLVDGNNAAGGGSSRRIHSTEVEREDGGAIGLVVA